MTHAVSPAREASSPTLYGGTGTRRITVRDLTLAKERGEKWPMLTAYDAMTASVFDEAASRSSSSATPWATVTSATRTPSP